MVDFLCKVYRSFVDAISVILLVIASIVGFVYFGNNYGDWDFNYLMALGGAIIGFLGCFIFELIVIPPLMILFTIDSKLEKFESKSITNTPNLSSVDVNQTLGHKMDKVDDNQTIDVASCEESVEEKNVIEQKSIDEENLKTCPYCMGILNNKTKVCRYCGKKL